jgi:nicotinamidase/pyrazinamidase
MEYIIKNETASIDIDCQRGFSELCPDELPVIGALEIVPELNKQALKAKLRIASKDVHNPNGLWIADDKNPQFSVVGLPNVDIRWKKHCTIATDGCELLPGLPAFENYDFMIAKGYEKNLHPYGICYHDLADTKSTGIIEYLKVNNITTVILGGLAEDFCLFTSAKQLKKAGFYVIVNLSATKAIDFNGSKQKTEDEMKVLGIKFVENSENIIVLQTDINEGE